MGKRLCGVISCVALILFSILTAEAANHKIKAGDTLWVLAKKHHTTPRAIAKANRIGENATLALGKSLVIPGKGNSRRTSSHSHGKLQRQASARILVHTTKDNACLRSKPSTSSTRIAVLEAGTTAKRLGRSGNWIKVALGDGRCGYVYKPLIGLGRGASASASRGGAAEVAGDSKPNDSRLIQMALDCRGARYRRGGTSRGGFDCSGFTRYIFAKYGTVLPHSSAAQARIGTPVAKGELRAGDLVFFHTYRSGVSHVGIYVGENRFVHAATHGRGVTVDSLGSSYYSSRYRGARRVR